MKMFKRILAVLLIVIGILMIISVFMPKSVHVQRSVKVNAPVSIVYDQVCTLKNWEQWSPWYKAEPDMKLTYNNIPSGKGASYSWVGKTNGEGTLTIIDCQQNERIVTALDFKGQGRSTGGFTLAPNTGGLEVVWFMDMTPGMNPLAKYMTYMFKGMLEKQFDEGLQGIKQIVEAKAKEQPAATTPATLDSTTVDSTIIAQ